MLYTLVVLLLLLWLIGLFTGHTLGGMIHILLVVVIVILLVNMVSGKKPG
jgi:hypothetical protein